MANCEPARTLVWAHGSLTVQRLGAMLGPVRFVLDGRRSAQPMHMPPWAGASLPPDVPPILRGLRGEWPCVPFGAAEPSTLVPAWRSFARAASPLPPDPPAHGESSNLEWSWQAAGHDRLRLKLDYPAVHPVARVERLIVPDPDTSAIDCVLQVLPRASCRLPIGLHPTFALPAEAGTARIIAPSADHVRSYPGALEPGAPIFAPDAMFDQLTRAPAHGGGTFDASRVPFAAAGEDLAQLVGVARGRVLLDQHAAGYRVTLSWNATHFPSLLIWYSNRGRRHMPWCGRHTALGLEPVCSAFDLGAAVAAADNPIARHGVPTARVMEAGQLFETRYRIAVEPLHAEL